MRLLRLPIVRDLHGRGLLFPAALLLATGLVLLDGAGRRAPAVVSAALSPPPLTRPPLRPALDKIPLSYQSEYWTQLAESARARLALVGPDRIPAVLVRPGVAAAPLGALEDAVGAAQAGEAEGRDRLLGSDVDLGLVFVAPAGVHEAFTPAPTAERGAGSLLAAVMLTSDGRISIVPGHLSTAPAEGGGSLEAALPLPPSRGAAAVVDLDGALLGLAIGGENPRLLSTDAVLRAADRLSQDGPCPAVEVGPLASGVAGLLGIDGGALVERVRNRAFSSPAPVRPGDVVLEWAGRTVTAVDDYWKVYREQRPGAHIDYRIHRDGASIAGRLIVPGRDCRAPAPPPDAFPALGLALRWKEASGDTPAGWSVVSVTSAGIAARAGLETGDLVVEADGRPLSKRGGRRILEAFETRPKPIVLGVRREGRAQLLAVMPAP
jgi:hypothetical protein